MRAIVDDGCPFTRVCLSCIVGSSWTRTYRIKMASPSPQRFVPVRITNRHKWMITTIAHTFGVDEKIADQFIRERESQDVLEPFFQVDGPKRIMVYYQPQTIGGPKTLFFTDGASDQLVGKGCYFVRMN